MNDKKRESLLDYLCVKLGNIFISDMKYDPDNKKKIALIVSETNVEQFPKEDWLEACFYITNKKTATAVEAKEILKNI